MGPIGLRDVGLHRDTGRLGQLAEATEQLVRARRREAGRDDRPDEVRGRRRGLGSRRSTGRWRRRRRGAVVSRYQSGVPSGWSMATRPTNARCPGRGTRRPGPAWPPRRWWRSRPPSSCRGGAAWAPGPPRPARRTPGRRSGPPVGTCARTATAPSGRSRHVPSCGHCGAWTCRSTSPGSSTCVGPSSRRCAAWRRGRSPAGEARASTARWRRPRRRPTTTSPRC